MLARSRSDHQSLKAHFFLKRVAEQTPISDYTTTMIQRSVLEDFPALSTEKSAGFIPFWKERDSLGRLITESRKGSTGRTVKTESFVKTQSHSPLKKSETHQKLHQKPPSGVPPVGTYRTVDSWIKKSFHTPKSHHRQSSISEDTKAVSVERKPRRTETNIEHSSSVRRLRRKRGTHRADELRNEDEKQRNNFSTLRLEGLPSELLETLSFRHQLAIRDQSMRRFKALSKAVMRRMPQF